jgi:hypothetical protein
MPTLANINMGSPTMKMAAKAYLRGFASTESKTIPPSLKSISKILKEKSLKKIIENGFVAIKANNAEVQNPRAALISFCEKRKAPEVK